MPRPRKSAEEKLAAANERWRRWYRKKRIQRALYKWSWYRKNKSVGQKIDGLA